MRYQVYLYYIPIISFIISIGFLIGISPFYNDADRETQQLLWNIFVTMIFTTLLTFMLGVGILLWDFGEDCEKLYTNTPFTLRSDDKISDEFPTFDEYWEKRNV